MLDFSNSKILIVGDVMLDKYYFGKVDRISPEAPVPIVNIQKEESRLGERIQKFAVLWNERKEELSRLKSDTEAARRMLPAIEAKIKDLEILERNSALSLEKEREKYEKIKAERACLFGGRSLKDIEGEYELALKAGEAGTAETIRQYTGLISLRENLLGSVAQLQQNLAAGQRDISRGQKIIADWLLAHSDLSEERLSELLTHTLAWVADEKGFIVVAGKYGCCRHTFAGTLRGTESS